MGKLLNIRPLSRSIPVGVRFGLQVNRHENGCWLWRGNKNRKGYGSIYINGKRDQAHRVAWRLFHGDIPDGLFVLHRCDTPQCVNPQHLFLGTPKDNAQDAIAKGRFTQLHGEEVGTSKLTNEQAAVIRRSDLTAKQIAAQYGITIWTVYDIRKGRSWSHHL